MGRRNGEGKKEGLTSGDRKRKRDGLENCPFLLFLLLHKATFFGLCERVFSPSFVSVHTSFQSRIFFSASSCVEFIPFLYPCGSFTWRISFSFLLLPFLPWLHIIKQASGSDRRNKGRRRKEKGGGAFECIQDRKRRKDMGRSVGRSDLEERRDPIARIKCSIVQFPRFLRRKIFEWWVDRVGKRGREKNGRTRKRRVDGTKKKERNTFAYNGGMESRARQSRAGQGSSRIWNQ